MDGMPLIIDGHLDLSMNAMEWNRDLRMPIEEIRALEKGLTDKPDRGLSTVCFPEMRKGNIKLCIATLIARYAKPSHPLGGWRSPEQAWSMAQSQLSWYREMERQGEMKQVRNSEDLKIALNAQKDSEANDIHYLLSLEGADSIVTMDHLAQLRAEGLIAVGPAHYGPGTYSYGTDSDGPIGEKGKLLLKTMDELDMVLDVTHLSDTSFWEALEVFQGPIWASHSNCRSIVNHNRQFTDDQIKVIIERGGIIGLPLDAWMMVPGWIRGESHPNNTSVTLEHMMDHLLHICDITGNVDHVAIGTDLDGGFGREQCPSDVQTIADLQTLNEILHSRGFDDESIQKVLNKNWLIKFEEVLI